MDVQLAAWNASRAPLTLRWCGGTNGVKIGGKHYNAGPDCTRDVVSNVFNRNVCFRVFPSD